MTTKRVHMAPAQHARRSERTQQDMPVKRAAHMAMRSKRSVFVLEKRQGGLLSVLSGALDPSDSSTTAAVADTSTTPASVAPSTTSEAPATTAGSSSSSSSSESSSDNTGSTASSNSGSTENNSPAAAAPKSSARSSTAGSSSAARTSSAAAVPVAASQTVASASSVVVNGQTIAATTATSAASVATASVVTSVTVVTDSNGHLTTSTYELTSLPSAGVPSVSSSVSLPFLSGTASGSSGTGTAQETQGALAGDSTSPHHGAHKTVAIAVPIAVVLGLLLIGLVALGMARHKKRMERDMWAAPMLAAAEERRSESRMVRTPMSYGTGRRGSHYGEATSVGHGGALGAGAAAAGAYGVARDKSNTSIRRAIRSGEFEYDDASSYGEHAEMSDPGQPVSTHRAVGRRNTEPISEEDADMATGESDGNFSRYGVDDAAYTLQDARAYYEPTTDSAYVANTQQQGDDNMLSPFTDLKRGQSNERLAPRVSFAGTEASAGDPNRAYGGADFLSNQYNYNNLGNPDQYQSRFSQPDDSVDQQAGAGAKMRSYFKNKRWSKK